MPTNRSFTDENLIKLLKNQLMGFSDTYVPLTAKDLAAVLKFSSILTWDRNGTVKNFVKRRAQSVLTDIWTHLPAAFVLCSLVTSPTKIGQLKSQTYIAGLCEWWETAPRPEGLLLLVQSLSKYLPTYNFGTQAGPPSSVDHIEPQADT